MTAVGTYNVHYRMSAEDVDRDLRKLVRRTQLDVLGLQEFGHNRRQQVLDRLLVNHGYASHRPNTAPYEGSTPILWNTMHWHLTDAGSMRISDEVMAEPARLRGDKGALIEAKHATWVVLERRQGSRSRRIAVINWHAPASVEDPAKVKRRKAMRQCAVNVAELSVSLLQDVDDVYVVGDMNVDWRDRAVRSEPRFPVQTMRKVGLYANWSYGKLPKLGTHAPNGMLQRLRTGRRLIDYVFSGKEPLSSRILYGHLSDHRPVLVTYR